MFCFAKGVNDHSLVPPSEPSEAHRQVPPPLASPGRHSVLLLPSPSPLGIRGLVSNPNCHLLPVSPPGYHLYQVSVSSSVKQRGDKTFLTLPSIRAFLSYGLPSTTQ